MLYVERGICTGCRLCEKKCTQKAIKVAGGKAYIDNSRCSSCYQCIYVCPRSAIKVTRDKKEKNYRELKKVFR